MTNTHNTTIYVGVTSDLIKRVYEHKAGIHKQSFTVKYNLTKLVYYEAFHSIEEAITREKQIKGGSRQKKLDLVNGFNPEWEDLYDRIVKEW